MPVGIMATALSGRLLQVVGHIVVCMPFTFITGSLSGIRELTDITASDVNFSFTYNRYPRFLYRS